MSDEFEGLPKTRKEAKETDSKFYFTGQPCKHGHINKRRTNSGTCRGCETTPEYLENSRIKSRRRAKEKPEAIYEYNKKYRLSNPDKYKGWRQKWKDNNKDQIRESAKRYREENKERLAAKSARYYQENKEWLCRRNSEWARKNPDKGREKTMRYTMKKQQRTLDFSDEELIELNEICIKEIYKSATDFSELTGEFFEVDHIIPISGKTVSGLHVWYNLRVVPLEVNRRKSNKLIDGVYDA